MRASDLPLLTSAEFRNGRKVAKATHEHCCHPRKQHGTDLEAGKAVHTANAREHGDGAQKHAESAANPTNPQQKNCHARSTGQWRAGWSGRRSSDVLRLAPPESAPTKEGVTRRCVPRPR